MAGSFYSTGAEESYWPPCCIDLVGGGERVLLLYEPLCFPVWEGNMDYDKVNIGISQNKA